MYEVYGKPLPESYAAERPLYLFPILIDVRFVSDIVPIVRSIPERSTVGCVIGKGANTEGVAVCPIAGTDAEKAKIRVTVRNRRRVIGLLSGIILCHSARSHQFGSADPLVD